MIRNLRELWQYRALLWNLTQRELKARYRGSGLGFLWTFLNPLLLMAVYALVFGVIQKSNIPHYTYFVFVGLLPWPERIMGAGLIGHARRRESAALLGAAFAVCAAPCIGPVLASVLVLASSSSTVLRGSVLLLFYSLGIGVAFLLAGIAFARAMGAFRWVRDHYTVIRVISGVTLIALGLLLFFGKDWWLHVMLNRALDGVGLGQV